MTITLYEDIERADLTWVEKGTYQIVRYLDKDRVLIDVSRPLGKRILTIVPIAKALIT